MNPTPPDPSPGPAPSTRRARRQFTLAALAAGAAAAGAGLWWQGRQPDPEQARAELDPAVDAETAGFWRMAFAHPNANPATAEGSADGTAAIATAPIATARFLGRPLVLNFWGTWCPPCIKEMPELDRFARAHAAAGWQVLGLAVDNARAVREFLARTPVGFAVAMAGFEGSELARALGNSQGGLPYTVLFGSNGRVAHRIAGETHAAALTELARGIR